MPRPSEPFDFSALSIDERILLAETLWDSVYESASSLAVSEAIKTELDSRAAGEKSGEIGFTSWEEAKHQLLKK